jgi:hypothetical protein
MSHEVLAGVEAGWLTLDQRMLRVNPAQLRPTPSTSMTRSMDRRNRPCCPIPPPANARSAPACTCKTRSACRALEAAGGRPCRQLPLASGQLAHRHQHAPGQERLLATPGPDLAGHAGLVSLRQRQQVLPSQ